MSETPQPSQEPQITPQIRARTAINIYQKLFRGERVAPAVMSCAFKKVKNYAPNLR
ncbi:MAG: hypothetical protein HYT83_00135 [Candidatus Levybacteria bacterium]|nr:hypothetical protein [Candidatus Levybacteria bacterium]